MERARAAQGAGELFAGSSYDPTATAGLVAWQRPSGIALLSRAGAAEALPGTHPALGGARIAWREGDAVVVADAATLQRRERHHAPGAGALAVSDLLAAWRVRDAAGTDRIWTAPRGGRPRPLTGLPQILREEPGAQLSNPATDGELMLYVHATGRAQELRLGTIEPLAPEDDEVLLVHPSSGRRDREREPNRRRHRHEGIRPALPPRAEPGVVDTLWTTALTAEAAYVTRLRRRRGQPRTADILRVAIAA